MEDTNSALEKGFHQHVCWLTIEIKKGQYSVITFKIAARKKSLILIIISYTRTFFN